MTTKPFDASKYLTDLHGRDYLEVKWRLLWLRTEHPESIIETELVKHGGGLALFRARVAVPGGGTATGWGSETADDFEDFIEKAETKALGRALAALGFGTQFCEDFDFSAERQERRRSEARERKQPASKGAERVVDAPVSRPSLKVVRDRDKEPATASQLNAIHSIARHNALAEADLEAQCQAAFGCGRAQLSKRQASQFIDQLRKPEGPATAATAAASSSS